MKKITLWVLSIFFVITTHAKDYYFKHLGVSDGLSQICIQAIYQDELGAVWLGSTEGLNRYNGKEVRIFRPSENNQGLTNNEIYELCGNKNGQMFIRSGNDLVKLDLYTEQFTCLLQDKVRSLYCEGDTLWIGCTDGIYYYTEKNKELIFYTELINSKTAARALFVNNEALWVVNQTDLIVISRKNPHEQTSILKFSSGRCISSDSSGNIWVGTWQGVFCVSPDRQIRHYNAASKSNGISDNQVRCILEDDFGNVWAGTFRGLDRFDPETNQWTQYSRHGDSSNTLSHNSIMALHKDMQGNIWVGTYYGGASIFNPNKYNNHFYYPEPSQPDRLSFPFVGRMTEDTDGNLWVCTEGGGLNCLVANTNTFFRFTYQVMNNNSVRNNNLKSIYFREENDQLYVGTHMGGLYIFNLLSMEGHTLRHEPGNPYSLPNDIVNDIQEYKGQLIIMTQGGLVLFDPVSEKFSPLSDNLNIQKILNKKYGYEAFLIDSKDRLWLAQATGGVVSIHLPSSHVEYHESQINNPSFIGKFKVVHIIEDSRGGIYFCTVGSGMFKYQEDTNSFVAYNTLNEKLLSDYCYYIYESTEKKRLYLLHNNGLSVFNPDTEKIENTQHLFEQNYNQGSSIYKNKEGTIFIGGTNGLASIREESLFSSYTDNYLGFDRLLVFNKEILPNDETGILSEVLSRTSDIHLNYNQNNITVEYAPFNYRFDRNLLYEYCLDNLDGGWTQTASTSVTYTNLSPGDYTFRVRQVGNPKDSKEIKLGIHIAAPFYATTFAYFIYILIIFTLVFLFIRFKTHQAALKSSLEYERKEKERIEELNQMKLRFFTNISHEFRTPLTLILGQIEILMQMDKLEPGIYNRIVRIYKNAWHMRNLISELLDFRKQEQGYLKLKVEEQDLILFTRQIYVSFYEYAQKKKINYRFEHSEEKIHVWFDPTQLQKVVFNLLSNAFKYSSNNGTIKVEVKKTSSQAIVSISDTGSGIDEKYINKIFERFYQTDNSSSFFTLGTGIGLALSKGIVDTHHGTIEVQSKVGEGTTFRLVLPLGNAHFSKDELIDKGDNETFIEPENIEMVPWIDQIIDNKENKLILEDNAENDKPVILLVEDNDELLSMLTDVFQPMYEVYTAHNGREGYEMAQQIQPDLILSDVMMPEMSGKELCYKIKNNIELSHISVILLTAQTSVEYIVEGYMFGADDYITKPFNVKVLIARCNNLIKNKKRLHAYYAGKPITETTEIEAITERDKQLLEKSITVVKENFTNPEFNVTTLASELCMGRSKLYTQFKQITGLTPNEFILKVKLDEAMMLLNNHPELNISEISLRLGFSSPRYFRKCFKAFFGVTPLDVRKKD